MNSVPCIFYRSYMNAGGSDFILRARPFGATLEYTSSIACGRASVDSSSGGSSLNFLSSDVVSALANKQVRTSVGGDGFCVTVSSTPSYSSQGSGPDDIESLGDVHVWGEVWCESPYPTKQDALIPNPLESNLLLDVHQIACGVSTFCSCYKAM
ncbi:hypothetical protein RHGRI_003602 [Rhododendron griersonianum]|uniref:Uncharacterized protein n=1 Tax=Rhododendron griersonianum TaxID=479676 RepID=A0AAV6L5M7_9ERIC|nr:hypothetical protein RHGRI_003602 [Rhododendron griersonianum]